MDPRTVSGEIKSAVSGHAQVKLRRVGAVLLERIMYFVAHTQVQSESAIHLPIIVVEEHLAPRLVARVEHILNSESLADIAQHKVGCGIAGYGAVHGEVSGLDFIDVEMMLAAIEVRAHLHVVLAFCESDEVGGLPVGTAFDPVVAAVVAHGKAAG